MSLTKLEKSNVQFGIWNDNYESELTKHHEAETIKLWDFLSQNKPLLIPDYQREYLWNDRFIRNFLKSLQNNYDQKDYLNSIVLCSDNTHSDVGAVELVDGQQRITTIFLFLAASRRFILERIEILEEIKKNKKLTNALERELITIKGLRSRIDTILYYKKKGNSHDTLTPVKKPKIFSEKMGSDVLHALISNKEMSAKDIRELKKEDGWNKAVGDAYEAIVKLIENGEIAIINLIQKLEFATEVSAITYKSEEAGKEAFIAINTAQCPLGLDSLMESYITFPKEKESLKMKYRSIKSALGNSAQVEKYILHYFKAFHSNEYDIAKGTLFETVQDMMSQDEANITKVVDKMYEKLGDYQVFLGDRSDTQESTYSLVNFKILNLLTYQQHLPFFLNVSELDNREQRATIYGETVKYLVRSQTIMNIHGKRATHKLDSVTKTLGSMINEDRKVLTNKQLEKIISEFKETEITNKSLEQRMKEIFGPKKKYSSGTEIKTAKALMLYLENEFSVDKVVDPERLHLDHVLPKNSVNKNEDLKVANLTKKQAGKLLHRFGNLRLFFGKHNISVRDRLPELKKNLYSESELILNSKIPQVSNDIEKMIDETEKTYTKLLLDALSVEEKKSDKIIRKVA